MERSSSSLVRDVDCMGTGGQQCCQQVRVRAVGRDVKERRAFVVRSSDVGPGSQQTLSETWSPVSRRDEVQERSAARAAYVDGCASLEQSSHDLGLAVPLGRLRDRRSAPVVRGVHLRSGGQQGLHHFRIVGPGGRLVQGRVPVLTDSVDFGPGPQQETDDLDPGSRVV